MTSVGYNFNDFPESQLTKFVADIHPYLLRAGRSAANQPHVAAADDRRDRRTDGRTPDCYTDPAERTVSTIGRI